MLACGEGDYCLVLDAIGPNRLKVIAYVRKLLKLSLMEAKSCCTKLPATIAEGHCEDMHRLQQDLHAIGAEVIIRPLQRTFKKELIATVEMTLIGGRATLLPPVGATLKPYRINTGQFMRLFNERTRAWEGKAVRVAVSVFNDRSFTFTVTLAGEG